MGTKHFVTEKNPQESVCNASVFYKNTKSVCLIYNLVKAVIKYTNNFST